MKTKQKSDLDLRIFDPAIKNKFIMSDPIKTLFSFKVGFQSQDLHILIDDCSPLRFNFNNGFCIFSKKPEFGGLNSTGSPAISDHIKQTRISQNKHNLFNTKKRSVRGKVRTTSFSTLNASTITTVTILREI